MNSEDVSQGSKFGPKQAIRTLDTRTHNINVPSVNGTHIAAKSHAFESKTT